MMTKEKALDMVLDSMECIWWQEKEICKPEMCSDCELMDKFERNVGIKKVRIRNERMDKV